MFRRLDCYEGNVTSHDLMKAIAIIAMIIDHIGLYVFPEKLWLRVIGRSSAPLFFFATGYVSSHRFKLNILIYGILLTAITYITQNEFFFNILINFVLIKLLLDNYDPNQTSGGWLSIGFVLLIIANVFLEPYLEYGSFGILFAVGARMLAENNSKGIYWLIATLMAYFFNQTVAFQFFVHKPNEIALFLICLILLVVFYYYRLHKWSVPQPLRIFILFFGRYSLEIYFLHLLGFKIYAWFGK